LWGGIGAAVSFGVGSAAGGLFGAKASFGKALFQMGAHGLTQGGISAAQRGNFWQGALSGSISSGIGSGIDALGGTAADQIFGGGIGGGIGSAISGGNFWQGFGQGIAVGAFNHALHSSFSSNKCINCEVAKALAKAKGISYVEAMYYVVKMEVVYGAEFIFDAAHGTSDFLNAYVQLREANTIGADKYFHAKANYIATSRGAGGEWIARKLSNFREFFDQLKGDPLSASLSDQRAIIFGRQQAIANKGYLSQYNYRTHLSSLVPNGLHPQY
jgi:hypothetical protein